MEPPIEMKDIADYFCVSGSSIYSSIKSTIFPLTSSSVLPCVAMSNMRQDATNHFPSLLMSTGKDIIAMFILLLLCMFKVCPSLAIPLFPVRKAF